MDHRGGEHSHERRRKGMAFDLEFVVVCKKWPPKGLELVGGVSLLK